MSQSSNRPVFALSITNSNASDRNGVFPVIDESEKVDGEGVTPHEDFQVQQCAMEKTPKLKSKKQKGNVDKQSHITVLSDYKEIDDVVIKLYDIFTRDPSVLLQIQIDRYLFAASSEFVAECGGDMRTCILYESQVPSIFNLPDIIYILRHRLIHGSWSNAMQETVCRYTIPGMQKSRWVARQRKVPLSFASAQTSGNTRSGPAVAGACGTNADSGDQRLVSVYINTMLGLL